MFTVEMTVDPGLEQFLDVLPPLLVAAARDVGVGELVDEGHLGTAGEDGVDVHLLEFRWRGHSSVAAGRPPGRRSSAAVCCRP